ncbi:60S ribosomal protein L12 [Lemmus lemmus]
MLPKFDPNEIKVIYLKYTGSKVGATSALAPKIGLLGLSPQKVGDGIAKATSDWKGLKSIVKLTTQNRQSQIGEVCFASAQIIKTLKEPPRDRKRQKNIKHSGNISFDEITNIVPQM